MEDYREDIFKERRDRFVDYKTGSARSGRSAASKLIEVKGDIESWLCGACGKPFITVSGEEHRAYYSPCCGTKIEYGDDTAAQKPESEV